MTVVLDQNLERLCIGRGEHADLNRLRMAQRVRERFAQDARHVVIGMGREFDVARGGILAPQQAYARIATAILVLLSPLVEGRCEGNGAGIERAEQLA